MWLFKLYLFWLNTLIHKGERILQQSRSCKIWECFFLAGSTMSVDLQVILISTAWKVSVIGLFLVLIFRHSNSYSVRMRKIRTRKTSNMDTFHPAKNEFVSFEFLTRQLWRITLNHGRCSKKSIKWGRDGKKGLGCKKGERGNFGTDKLSRNLIYRKI